MSFVRATSSPCHGDLNFNWKSIYFLSQSFKNRCPKKGDVWFACVFVGCVAIACQASRAIGDGLSVMNYCSPMSLLKGLGPMSYIARFKSGTNQSLRILLI